MDEHEATRAFLRELLTWPESAREQAVDAFLRRFPCAEFGPAHIVLSDYNVSDEHIRRCLEHWDEYAGEEPDR